MPDFLRSLLVSAPMKALALMGARKLGAVAGSALVAWLVAKHADPNDAQNFAGYLTGALITGVSIVFSMLNVTDNEQKKVVVGANSFDAGLAHARAEGEQAQATVDQARATAVKSAIKAADTKASNDNVDDVLARMRAGAA